MGLVDSQEQALADCRTEFPTVPTWSDLQKALPECDAEAWVVATSTASHAAVAKTLLSKSFAVLVEKPIAHNLAAAAELAPLVTPDSANFMLGHIMLFNSEFRQLRDEMQRRGARIYIDCIRHRPARLLSLFPGETPVRLLMVHDLYCVLALMQRVEPHKFVAQIHHTSTGDCDLAIARLFWEDGTIASFTASFLTPDGMPADGFDRMEVFGQGWAARMDPNPRPMQIWDDRARWPFNLEIRAGDDGASGMLAEELRCFCRVVRGQQSVPLGATYTDAMQVERWLDCIEFAARASESKGPKTC